VAAIIGPESGELADALLVGPAARSVLLISPGISPEPTGPPAALPWFRVAPSTRAMAESLARRLADLKIPRVLVLATADRYNASFAASFQTRFQQLGGATSQRTLPDDQVSYSEVLPDLAGADHVLLAARAETAARVVNEMSAFDDVPRWHLPPALRSDSFVLNASPHALTGALGVSPDVEVQPDFHAAFAAHWQGDTPLESALFYYDALALFAMAYERAFHQRARHPTAAEIAEAMFAVAFPNGIATRWSELATGITDLRQGTPRYYRGLTGSIVLERDGQRGFGRDKLWTVDTAGAITDLP
jgi:ABC-type branched-subunit amino acid transport system substrate-binding protein